MLSPLDRRGVLLLAAGAGVGAAGPITAQPDANAELAALLDAYARSTFDRHPELVTALGLDRGSLAPARWQLDERSVERIARDREILASYQRQLHTIDRARLSPRSALHYDVFHYELMRERAVADWQGLGRPYVIDQFDHGMFLVSWPRSTTWKARRMRMPGSPDWGHSPRRSTRSSNACVSTRLGGSFHPTSSLA